MISGQDAQSSRIDGKTHIQAVLHRKIDDRILKQSLIPALAGEIFLKPGVDCVHGGQERIVVCHLFKLILRDQPQDPGRVLAGFQPGFVIKAYVEQDGLEVPAYPQVVGQLIEGLQPFRDIRFYRIRKDLH